jgi:hypothetical protein
MVCYTPQPAIQSERTNSRSSFSGEDRNWSEKEIPRKSSREKLGILLLVELSNDGRSCVRCFSHLLVIPTPT